MQNLQDIYMKDIKEIEILHPRIDYLKGQRV